ncbi:MAG: hypothetical protein GY849_11365, partial [Deltaproteobacteria bacterium]|nr:hypothetical protein [Deltaproteobacteria bacterium]
MNETAFSQHKTHKPMARVLLSMDGSQGFRQTLSWSVFLMGLIFWITVQGAFSLIPLWTR